MSAGWWLCVASLIALANAASAQSPVEERLAVVVGANVGDADDEPLRYAQSDARRMRDTLVELGGIRTSRASLVLGDGVGPVLEALAEARERAVELGAAGRRVIFLFYYSGHGDDGALHLAGQRLSLAELRKRIGEIPSDVRITLLDSCRTGVRGKGVHRGPEFALSLNPSLPAGSVELRAASAGEPAQESEELMGALFTHSLLSGLRGAADADRDGRVTLFELYTFAYRATLLRSERALNAQRASLDIDLRGAGELVLSQPARAESTLEIRGDGESRYIVFSLPSGAVMGEVGPGGDAALALPAGQFLIQRQSGSRRGVAWVALPWGGRRRVLERDFVSVSREELVAKGGTVELRPNRLEARAGVETAVGAAEQAALRAGASFVRLGGALELEVELAYLRGVAATAGRSGDFQAASAVAGAGVRALFSRGTLFARAGVEGRYTWAWLARPDADRLRAAQLGLGEHFSFPSLGPRLAAGGALSLGADFVASAGVSAGVLFRCERTAGAQPRVVGRPHLAVNLGVGHAF